MESFIDECSSFPNGKYDDQVDQMTQVLNRLRGAVAVPKKPSTGLRRAAERRTQLDEVGRLIDYGAHFCGMALAK